MQLYNYSFLSVTVGANLLITIILCIPNIPPAYKISATLPNLLLQNAMACRVFRLLKLGALKANKEGFMLSLPRLQSNQQRSSIVFNVATTTSLDADFARSTDERMQKGNTTGITQSLYNTDETEMSGSGSDRVV